MSQDSQIPNRILLQVHANELQKAFLAFAKTLRESLKDDEKLKDLDFRSSIIGPVHTGELALQYQMGENSYSNTVTGDDIVSLIDEFQRRRGYCIRHASLRITQASGVKPGVKSSDNSDDSIPI